MIGRWAALVAALLLAVVGCGAANEATGRDGSSAPTTPTTSQPTTSQPAKPYGAMTIARSADGFTVTGEVPDAATQTSLPQLLRQVMPGAKIVDHLVVKAGVAGPDIAGLGGLFGAALDIPDFTSSLTGDTVTLRGRAPSERVKSAAEDSVEATWPGVVVVDDIAVGGAAVPSPLAGGCATVADEAKAPITFATNASAVTSEAQRRLGQLATTAKGCADARVTVTGFTDSTGDDAVNVPLSANRAKAVADALVAAGLPQDAVTSKGLGAAHPVGDNDTAAGRAQNRRVEISVVGG